MTPADQENRTLRAENARLAAELDDARAEIRNLRQELGAEADADMVAKFTATWKITPGDARLLAALYQAGGRTVTHERLVEALPGKDDRAPNLVSVRVANVRRMVGREVIRNAKCVGYSLTPVGIALCEAAIAKQEWA